MEDDRVNALALTMQHLLRRLERKGAISPQETTDMLDDVLEKMRERGPFSPGAHRMIGRLYLPT